MTEPTSIEPVRTEGAEKTKQPKSDNNGQSRKKKIIDNIKSLAVAIVLVLIIRSSIIEAYKIPSGSMIPTLFVGDHIFVNKFSYGLKVPFSDLFWEEPIHIVKRPMPERGDIIVFKFPKNESYFYIKRVVGVPGDRIRIRDKVVYVNDTALEQTPVNNPELIEKLEGKYDPETVRFFDEKNPLTKSNHLVMIDHDNYITGNFGEITVPENQLFVMGDNRDNSNDSRFWGFVPLKNVQGKAMVVWLSLWLDFSKEEYYFRPGRFGKVIN